MTQQQDTLGAALDFTADDLSANRAGVLSARQRDRMTKNRQQGRTVSLVMGGLMLAIIVVLAAVELPNLNKQSGDSVPIVPIAGGVLVLIVLILTLQFARNRRALNRFVGAVHHVDGVVATRAHRIRGNVVDTSAGGFGYGGGMRYEVKFGRTVFFVPSQAVLAAFEDGRTYRGYYTGNKGKVMGRLLSAEQI
jgi:hypothetical protein